MEERLLWWGATPLVTADRETGTARMGAMRSFLYTFVIYIFRKQFSYSICSAVSLEEETGPWHPHSVVSAGSQVTEGIKVSTLLTMNHGKEDGNGEI